MVATNKLVTEILNWYAGNSATKGNYINVGDDNTQPTKADTALASELGRVAIDVVTISNNQIELRATLLSTQQNGQTLREFGLNTAASSGNQHTRSVHTDIEKNANIEVRYRIRLRLSN